MLGSYHSQDCDICANKGPCFYCGRKHTRISDKKYIIDYIYDVSSIVAVTMANDGHISHKSITKSELDDLYVEVKAILGSEPLFGIPDIKAATFFDKKPLVIKATKPFLHEKGLTIILLGVL